MVEIRELLEIMELLKNGDFLIIEVKNEEEALEILEKLSEKFNLEIYKCELEKGEKGEIILVVNRENREKKCGIIFSWSENIEITQDEILEILSEIEKGNNKKIEIKIDRSVEEEFKKFVNFREKAIKELRRKLEDSLIKLRELLEEYFEISKILEGLKEVEEERNELEKIFRTFNVRKTEKGIEFSKEGLTIILGENIFINNKEIWQYLIEGLLNIRDLIIFFKWLGKGDFEKAFEYLEKKLLKK